MDMAALKTNDRPHDKAARRATHPPQEPIQYLLRIGDASLKMASASSLLLTRFSAAPQGRAKRVMLIYDQ
jgi:hypothetical protein